MQTFSESLVRIPEKTRIQRYKLVYVPPYTLFYLKY